MTRYVRPLFRYFLLGMLLALVLSASLPAQAAPAPAVAITWVGNLTPGGNSPQTITNLAGLPVAVEVYAPGVTDSLGQGAGIQCWLHYGQVSSFGGAWNSIFDAPMIYSGDIGNNDRYGITLGPLAAGLYEYTAWCSGDGGATAIWADISGTGGNGRLTVTAAATPTPTPSVVPTATPTVTPTPTPVSGGVVISQPQNLNPSGNTPQTIDTLSALFVTVDVFAAGVTPAPGAGPGIQCSLHYGQVPAFGGSWNNTTDFPMAFVADVAGSDRYGVNMGPLPAGLYEYTAWCSGDGGATRQWANIAATGGNGKLTVVPTGGPTPTWTPLPPPPTALPPGLCQEWIVNGGFEWDGAWTFGGTARPPVYAGAPNPVRSGLRSMQLGIVPPQADVDTYSSIAQVVAIPSDAVTAAISFWYYPMSDDPAGGFDRQELILLNPWNNETIRVLWRVTENDRTWKQLQFDLTPFRGQTVAVYFNARNSGNGPSTAMFLDDVSLLSCQSTTAPTPIPTMIWPTPSPWPRPEPPVGPAGDNSIAAGPTVVVTIEGQPEMRTPERGTPIAQPTATPASGRSARPIDEILNNLGPWAVLCLMGIIIIVSVALLVNFLSKRSGS
jgi:hypothetical protein